MKITRNFNGKEYTFELTEEEMRKAYWEKKEQYDAEDIRSRYNVPDDKINEAVNRFEKAIESNDSFWESYWMALEYVCDEMGFEEKEEDE